LKVIALKENQLPRPHFYFSLSIYGHILNIRRHTSFYGIPPSYGQAHLRRVGIICERWAQALIFMGHQ